MESISVFVVQEREEALVKRQKACSGDNLELSGLTMEEPASPVEEVVTTTSSTKVSLRNHTNQPVCKR